jgi:hypothetical protein
MLDEYRCYSDQTQIYFEEVLQSYNAHNYRASVVLLYTTVIYDIIDKLRELSYSFSDSIATTILRDIDRARENGEGYEKSKWEWDLVVKVHKETRLFDDTTFNNIEYLKKCRNLCSHPSVNPDYQLQQPTCQSVAAHVQNMYAGLLYKPAVFIKSIVEHLTNFVRDNQLLFKDRNETLEKHLRKQYFSKMTDPMMCKVFCTIWKFSFVSDASECIDNHRYTRQLLVYMYVFNPALINKDLESNPQLYTISSEKKHKVSLLYLVLQCPDIIQHLPAILITQVTSIEFSSDSDQVSFKILRWFEFKSLDEYRKAIISIITEKPGAKISETILGKLKSFCVQRTRHDVYCDIAINYCLVSNSFDTADERIQSSIMNNLDAFSISSFHGLVKAICANDQLCKRSRAKIDNSRIAERIKDLDPNFDFSLYPVFETASEEEIKIYEEI